MKKYAVLLALVATAMGSQVFAQRGGGSGVYLGLGLMYQDSKVTTKMAGTSESKANETILDADLGYVFPSGLYLGGVYASDNTKWDSSDLKSSGMGASIGFMRRGLIAKLNYYISGGYETPSGKWSDGSGIGFDLGYLFPVSGSFNLGASLAYRDIKYKKYEAGGSSNTDYSRQATDIAPRLLLGFMF